MTTTMRKVTRKAISAFLNAEKFRAGNTEVKVLENVTVMTLHGNEIAYRCNDPEKTISIQNCGWFSNTTKERLNAIPGVSISQKKLLWYLNGKVWDGKLTDIK